jgi:energy-converting hydrogenase Eha subunit G
MKEERRRNKTIQWWRLLTRLLLVSPELTVAMVEVMVEAMAMVVVKAGVNCDLPKAVLVQELVQELALVLSTMSSWRIQSPYRKWKMELLTQDFTPDIAMK